MAAAVVTLLKATANSLKYSVTGATTETVNLDGSHASIANMPAGPLKTLLTTSRVNAAAHVAAIIGDAAAPTATKKVRISHEDESGYLNVLVTEVAAPGLVRFTLTGFELLGAAGFRSIFLIEYVHSLGR